MDYVGGPHSGSYTIALPFDLSYDGALIPQGTLIGVGANGAISLRNDMTPDTLSVGDTLLPMLIGPFSGDLRQGNDRPEHVADTVGLYQVDGTAPNRVLTIEYPAFHFRGAGTGGGGQATVMTGMQVKIYETTNVIEFIYKDHGLELPSNRPNVNASIGLSGAAEPQFVTNLYAIDTKTTPAADLRFTPGVASVSSEQPSLISIYPNPTSSYADITIPDGLEIKRIVAVNSLGSSNGLTFTSSRLDVRALATGTYFLRIETNKGEFTTSLSIVR